MKNIWKIAIIIMILLPAVSQVKAASSLESFSVLGNGTDVKSEEIDPSFKNVDLNIEEIIVYPHSIVLVRMEGTVESGNKFYAELEGNTFPGCLRVIVEGSTVKDIAIKSNYRYFVISPTVENTFSITKLLMDNKGKEIELLTKDGFYLGKIIGVFNGYIFLRDVELSKVLGETIEQRNVSFICMKLTDVENIVMMEEPELPDLDEGDKEVEEVDTSPKTIVKWEDTGSGSRDVKLLYVVSGVSWNSEYYLDILTSFEDESREEARLEHWAVIKNNLGFDLEDVNVRLVAGDIKLSNPSVSFGSEEYRMTAAQYYINAHDRSGGSSSEPSIFTMEEYEVYTISYKLTLKNGETRKLQLQACEVEIEKEFVYDATHLTPGRNSRRTWEEESNGKVQKIFKIKNEGKTWPAGMVNVYQDYMLIGQDGIQWTPKGREAKVTIGVSSDIMVKKKATVKRINPEDTYNKDYHYTIEIEMKNYKGEKVTLRVFDKFDSDALDLTSNPDFEEKPGNLMEWKITLEPDEEKKIVYTYDTR